MKVTKHTELPPSLNGELSPLPTGRRLMMRLALGLGLLPLLAACHHHDGDDNDNGNNNNGDVGVISDSRMKENITRIGTTAHGLPFYSFSYARKLEVYAGVMAQDVLGFMPEAVIPDPAGYYRVNYAKLGLRMLRMR